MADVEHNAGANTGHNINRAGYDRSHIPTQVPWMFFVRMAQLAVAFIVLVLTAYAAGKFNSGDLAGFGLAWFTFALTVIYIVWLEVSLRMKPQLYNYWAQLALEIACLIFWLCTFAVLASEANDLDSLGDYYFGYYNSSGLQSAIDCVKASAGLGALVFILFVISSAYCVYYVLSHRKANNPSTAGGINMHETKPGVHNSTAQAPLDGPADYPQQHNEAYPQPQAANEGYSNHQTTEAYPQQPVEAYSQPQQAYAIPATTEHHHQHEMQPPQQAYAVPAGTTTHQQPQV